MPIFEYRCRDCGRTHEFLQRKADEKPRCPYCGSSDLSKLMSKFNSNVSGTGSAAGCPTCSGGTCSTCGSK